MKKIILISLLLLACTPPESKTLPRPTPVVIDTNYCITAGPNLQKNYCIEDSVHYTKRGKSFQQFCEETQENGIYLNPKCLSNIQVNIPEKCKTECTNECIEKMKTECIDLMDQCTYSK